ncbi:hypothetical protein E2C01_073263 [Portunus trituberculatus]|uniref:Uncharacterized protein n=1 Tax=Portunus trituberculatus TaxID=210409 RepID=A0A5B7I9D5_PORTR|nr:hypothetical protein [Portunus trituberculatus]
MWVPLARLRVRHCGRRRCRGKHGDVTWGSRHGPRGVQSSVGRRQCGVNCGISGEISAGWPRQPSRQGTANQRLSGASALTRSSRD